MSTDFDRSKSLEQLFGRWPEPENPTYLVRSVHEARQRPLSELDAEQVRVLLSQEVDVEAVMPLALEMLARDPMLEGDYYPGAVLKAALTQQHDYWQAHPVQKNALLEVCEQLDDTEDVHEAINVERRRLVSELRSL